MQLLIPPKVVKQLKRELRRAGSREIGGLLMGECVGEEQFRLVEVTVQRTGGSHAEFMRQPTTHQAQLDDFFTRTGNDYSRFNYLGEWHSHPSFEAVPSITDIGTMQSIVDDPIVGAHFLVLLIVKLSGRAMELSATAFRPDLPSVAVSVAVEAIPSDGKDRWFHRLFSRLWR